MGVVAASLLFFITGSAHFIRPDFFRAMIPPWLPAHDALVAISGVAELVGAAGLLFPRTRRAAGWWLLALLLAVFPANVQMLLNARAERATPLRELVLWIRLPIQPLLMWWIWRVTMTSRDANGDSREVHG